MITPKSMQTMMSYFHQDLFLMETTLDGVVDYATRSLSEIEKQEIHEYLRLLLDGGMSVAQVRALWETMPKDIRIDADDELIAFLRHIKDKLASR